MRYAAYGTSISSEFELPGLTDGVVTGARPIEVAFGRVPAPPGVGSWTSLGPETCVLALEGVARLEVAHGVRITVEPDSDDLRQIAHFVMGPAMALLLGQRGLFPLHASAVDVGGEAVAIAGPSGAGKSTLALALRGRGHTLLADDIAALEVGGAATWLHPARCALRLNPDVIRARNVPEGAAERLHGETEKRLWPSPTAAAGATGSARLALSRIFVLRPGSDVCVEEVEGAARAVLLMANAHSPELLAGSLGARTLFDTCLGLSPDVRVFTLERPSDLDRLEDAADRVLEDRVRQGG